MKLCCLQPLDTFCACKRSVCFQLQEARNYHTRLHLLSLSASLPE